MQTRQADIIAFPARPAPAASEQGQVRLALALANLLSALDEQKAAVGAWRESLGELKQSVEKLGRNMGEYQASLAGLAIDVDQLNEQAHTLARITEAF